MNSPLQLDHYFFERMHCVANANISADEVEEWHGADESRFELRVELGTNPEYDREWQVVVDFFTNPDYEAKAPYELRFTAVGVFTVDEEFKHNDLERLIRVNGSSVLYSAMREFVGLFTSRAPWGAVKLPTVNFRLLAPEETNGTAPTNDRPRND